MKKRFLYFLPVVLWMSVIFLLSNRPAIKTSEFYATDFVIKKTAHFIEYAVLSFLLLRAFTNASTLSFSHAIFISLAVSMLYAVSDEIHQTFIPFREGRLRDVVIDVTGASFTLFLINRFYPRFPKLAKILNISPSLPG